MNKKLAFGLIALIGSSALIATTAAEARPWPHGPGYRAAGPVGAPMRSWRGGYGPRYYGPRYYGPGRGYYGGGYYYNGGAAALGILGGLALGGAVAAGSSPYYYEPPPCRIVHREVWVPGWGYRIRRVEICD